MSMQSLVIQFKISHVFYAVESQCLKYLKFKIVKMAIIILLLQFSWSPVWWPYIQFVLWCCRCTGQTILYIQGQYNDSINIQTVYTATIQGFMRIVTTKWH